MCAFHLVFLLNFFHTRKNPDETLSMQFCGIKFWMRFHICICSPAWSCSTGDFHVNDQMPHGPSQPLNITQIHECWRETFLSEVSKVQDSRLLFSMFYFLNRSCILASSSMTVLRNHSMSFFLPSLLSRRKRLIISSITSNWSRIFHIFKSKLWRTSSFLQQIQYTIVIKEN